MSEAVEVQDKKEVKEVGAGEDDDNKQEEEARNMVDINKVIVKDVILKSLESEGAQVSFEDCI